MKLEVVDEAGVLVGRVHDVRVRQDGPVGAGFDARLRVTGLVVGHGGVAHRLGYRWSRTRGPWLLRVLVRGRRDPCFVPWERIRAIDSDHLVISGSGDDLGPAEPPSNVSSGRPQ